MLNVDMKILLNIFTGKGSVYQHLSHTVEGMWTVRAFTMEDKFLRYFDIYMDRHTAAAHLYLSVNRYIYLFIFRILL